MGTSSKISMLTVVWLALLVGSNAEEKEAEQERRPIKTYKTIYGEIIDCIDMYRQPAFDHPLLKDHKLQKKPSFSLNAKNHRQRAQVKQPETSNVSDGCPDGTIPILRTTKEDGKRAKLPEQMSPDQTYHPTTTRSPGYHFAYVQLDGSSNPFIGAKAFMSNYIPKCENGQLSGAQIFIISDPYYPSNVIQVGWRVEPDQYNDDHSHLYTYWIADGSGCVDVQCPGFVQTDPSIALGQALLNSSTFEGPQIEIHVGVEQDKDTKDWWLIVDKDGFDIKVGYWPATLLPALKSGAKTLQYGGVTHTSNNMPSPPMGSGLFPDKSYSHACYLRQIHYMDGSQTWIAPLTWQGSAHTTSSACYGVAINSADQFMGYTLLFGGPGGSNCGV